VYAVGTVTTQLLKDPRVSVVHADGELAPPIVTATVVDGPKPRPDALIVEPGTLIAP
jgi:hypothetical protein